MALYFSFVLLPLPMAPVGSAYCLTPWSHLGLDRLLTSAPVFPHTSMELLVFSIIDSIGGITNSIFVFRQMSAAAAYYSQCTHQIYLASKHQVLSQFLTGFVPNGPQLG